MAFRVDETDLKILRVLQQQPGMSIVDLAARVGLSHTPCWRRIKQMETDGTITGRAILLDQKKLGLDVNVIAHVRLRAHDEDTLDGLERAVCARPEIVDCFSMSGDYDYVFRIIVADIEAYEQFLKKVLLHLPGVSSVSSSFALKRVKETTKLPI